MATPFRLPELSHRTAVIGRTGSGKTRLGTWLLSKARFDKQPFVILDYKGEELFDQIERLQDIDYNETPKHPGLYRLRPLPHELDDVEAWLWKVWKRGRTGLFFDEMYQLPDPAKGGALRAVFTQGRSKRIPVIGCTQRPRHISRFLFSEADFFFCFHLNTRGDNLAVEEFTPFDTRQTLARYHSRWYDVSNHEQALVAPVPGDDELLETFYEKLRPKRRIL